VWADLAEATGCTNASNGSVIDAASSRMTRVWFAKYGPAGWSSKPINLDQSLNDEFHPRLFQDSYTGSLILVYYGSGTTMTNDPTPRLSTDVLMKISEDQGENWSKPTKLTTLQTNEAAAGANNFQYGDYLGITGQNGFYFAAWTEVICPDLKY
jgi:hypothetical protein